MTSPCCCTTPCRRRAGAKPRPLRSRLRRARGRSLRSRDGPRGRGGWSPAAVVRGDSGFKACRAATGNFALRDRCAQIRCVQFQKTTVACPRRARWDAGVPLRAATLWKRRGVPAHRGRFALHGGGGAVAARLREGEGRPRQGRAARPGAQNGPLPRTRSASPSSRARPARPCRTSFAVTARRGRSPAARAADPRQETARSRRSAPLSRCVPGRGTGPRDHRPGRRLARRSLDVSTTSAWRGPVPRFRCR